MKTNSDSALIKSSGDEVIGSERRFMRRAAAIIGAALVVAIFVCLLTGRYNCTRFEVLCAFIHGLLDGLIWIAELPAKLIPGLEYSITNPIAVTWDGNVDVVLWSVRVPRIVATFFIGGGLAVSGASYQSLFRNPLVSESILGVSAGASLGAAIGILIGAGSGSTTAFAFVGGILAVFLTYMFSNLIRGNRTLLLVLTGSVVSSIFSAGLSIVKYIAPQETALPEITFWLMGSFSKIRRSSLLLLLPVIIVCLFIVMRIRWQMNVLALGDDEAKALGVNVNVTRVLIVISSTLITAVSVCVCGMIGWIGVIIPQITRMVIGPNTRRLVPCAFFIGGIFLMVVDLLCRNVTTAEIPVGIVTSLIGAPIFMIVLRRAREGWM
ncbi:MAG: iron ABC transporter permease [Oscillospiraceae bacterium]|nr:iron ABC transporter permease [Oscillospiraceae bacterium]